MVASVALSAFLKLQDKSAKIESSSLYIQGYSRYFWRPANEKIKQAGVNTSRCKNSCYNPFAASRNRVESDFLVPCKATTCFRGEADMLDGYKISIL
jgi:hypothetical protein